MANYRGQPGRTPGYTTSQPLLLAVRSLFDDLGHSDNMADMILLAVLHFGETTAAEPDPREFVRRGCDRHGINSSLPRDWAQVQDAAVELAIEHTYATTERFLRAFAKEYRQYHPEVAQWKSKDGSGRQLDPLRRVLENLPAPNRKTVATKPEVAILSYYREVRNYVVHRTTELSTVKELRDKLISDHTDHLNAEYAAIPNIPGELTYTDFQQFTRSVKLLARVLNEVAALTVEQIMHAKLRDRTFIAELRWAKKARRDQDKLAARIAQVYLLTEEQQSLVLHRILDFVQRDPPKKVRRRMNASSP